MSYNLRDFLQTKMTIITVTIIKANIDKTPPIRPAAETDTPETLGTTEVSILAVFDDWSESVSKNLFLKIHNQTGLFVLFASTCS